MRVKVRLHIEILIDIDSVNVIKSEWCFCAFAFSCDLFLCVVMWILKYKQLTIKRFLGGVQGGKTVSCSSNSYSAYWPCFSPDWVSQEDRCDSYSGYPGSRGD